MQDPRQAEGCLRYYSKTRVPETGCESEGRERKKAATACCGTGREKQHQ